MPLINGFSAVNHPDPILAAIAGLKGRDAMAKELAFGVYEVGHFGSSHWPPGFSNSYKYGVCDNYEQVLEHCKDFIEKVDCIITVTPIIRETEPDWGGWRWHKWGEYIGTQNPQHEYLYHDKHIDKVYVYHIYCTPCKACNWEPADRRFQTCTRCDDMRYVNDEDWAKQQESNNGQTAS